MWHDRIFFRDVQPNMAGTIFVLITIVGFYVYPVLFSYCYICTNT